MAHGLDPPGPVAGPLQLLGGWLDAAFALDTGRILKSRLLAGALGSPYIPTRSLLGTSLLDSNPRLRRAEDDDEREDRPDLR